MTGESERNIFIHYYSDIKFNPKILITLGNEEDAKELIMNGDGLDIDAIDSYGRSSLHLSLLRGQSLNDYRSFTMV